MDDRPPARAGETALSPERKRDRPRATKEEGARGGTMGFPTLRPLAVMVSRSRRLATALLLLGFGFVLLIPNWLVLPPDDENLSKEIVGTVFQSRELFSGRYPFWDPWLGFGVPEPLSQTLVFHPFVVLAEVLSLGAAIGALYQLQIWVGVVAV